MSCVAECSALKPAITRDQEARLYKFLRQQTEGDAFRYEMIAKKIHRAADGTAVEWELVIVTNWLGVMLELEAIAAAPKWVQGPAKIPFSDMRYGKAGNPKYQAYLDTLEQDELDTIDSNVGYFCWFSDRCAEMKRSGITNHDYLRNWADNHLSQRVKAIRGVI